MGKFDLKTSPLNNHGVETLIVEQKNMIIRKTKLHTRIWNTYLLKYLHTLWTLNLNQVEACQSGTNQWVSSLHVETTLCLNGTPLVGFHLDNIDSPYGMNTEAIMKCTVSIL